MSILIYLGIKKRNENLEHENPMEQLCDKIDQLEIVLNKVFY